MSKLTPSIEPSAMRQSGADKGLLILFLLLTIAAALALIPSMNHNVASGMNLLASNSTPTTAAQGDMGTVFDTLKYGRSIHILAMLLVGFGFLMVFVRKHGYSSITATFLVVSIALPMYMLLKSYGGLHFSLATINIDTFLMAEFAAASLLIAIGAPLGRLKMEQYFLMALLFIPAYILNEWLILDSGYLKGFLDTGGSVVIHAFGAYFGLGVVTHTLSRFKEAPDCESDATSNQFALLGSMILWLFWPSFTSALVSPDRVVLTAINTVFALCGATMSTFIFSRLLRGKIEIADIANAALAGGVAIGSICNMTNPGYALLIGIAAGALSTLGYAVIAPRVERLIQGTDTCGVHNLHGMPGIFGGLTGIIITGAAGVQVLGILATVIIAFVCGKITGFIISLVGSKEIPYNDEEEFLIS
ncbi:MAG TPA: ammonium transporter [Syntrophomonadaceae bacterium]|nr:ammonium transporter [Syntrophomonadaceae bacterium]